MTNLFKVSKVTSLQCITAYNPESGQSEPLAQLSNGEPAVKLEIHLQCFDELYLSNQGFNPGLQVGCNTYVITLMGRAAQECQLTAGHWIVGEVRHYLSKPDRNGVERQNNVLSRYLIVDPNQL